jgi:hypothetical protein
VAPLLLSSARHVWQPEENRENHVAQITRGRVREHVGALANPARPLMKEKSGPLWPTQRSATIYGICCEPVNIPDGSKCNAMKGEDAMTCMHGGGGGWLEGACGDGESGLSLVRSAATSQATSGATATPRMSRRATPGPCFN